VSDLTYSASAQLKAPPHKLHERSKKGRSISLYAQNYKNNNNKQQIPEHIILECRDNN
jgi:hypothetical protein